MKHSASASNSVKRLMNFSFLVVVIISGFLFRAFADFSAIFHNLIYTLLISWERVESSEAQLHVSVGFCSLNSGKQNAREM